MRKVLLAFVGLALVLTGCSGDGSSSGPQTPKQRLALAKKSLDAAQYIGFTLSTSQVPDGVDALLNAHGTGTHAPAFTGQVQVQTSFTITAPLIAVNGKVYAKLPFAGWSQLDPADYGAPNPATLMSRSAGVSSLFTKTRRPVDKGTERSGRDVLTRIGGTLPGTAVQALFPSAADRPFQVTYSLAADNAVHTAVITGPFYGSHGDVTYTMSLDLSASAVTIKPPSS